MQLESKSQYVDQANARFSESDELVGKIKDDLAEATAQLQQRDDQLQCSEERHTRLGEELKQAKDALQRTEELLVGKDMQLQETETRYSTLKRRLEGAEGELVKRAEQLTERDLQIETCSNQCSALEHDLEEARIQLNEKADSLARQLQDKDEEAERLQAHCSEAENEIQRLKTLLREKDALLAHEHEVEKELQALSVLLSEKDEVLTWLLEEVKEGMYLCLDLDQQREAVGTCAGDTIKALGSVLDKFRHLQNSPWLSLPAAGAQGKPPAKVSPTKLKSERQSKAKNLASSFFNAGEQESSGSEEGTPSRSSRPAHATPFGSAHRGRSPAREAREAAGPGSSQKVSMRRGKVASRSMAEPGDSHESLMEQAQGLVSELHRAFEMLHTSVSDDIDYYREIFGLVNELDQDLERALKQFRPL